MNATNPTQPTDMTALARDNHPAYAELESLTLMTSAVDRHTPEERKRMLRYLNGKYNAMGLVGPVFWRII